MTRSSSCRSDRVLVGGLRWFGGIPARAGRAFDCSARRALVAAGAVFALASCGYDVKSATEIVDPDAPPITVTVDDFRTSGASLRGRQVKLTGLCVRVGSAASSRDAYLVGEDPSFEVHVLVSGETNKLNRYAEGRILAVYGVVRDENWRYDHPAPTYLIDCDRYERVTAGEWARLASERHHVAEDQ